MPKRPILLILFPITVFLWLVGWTLYWLGSKPNRNQLQHHKTDPEDDTLCHFQLSPEALPPDLTENERHIN